MELGQVAGLVEVAEPPEGVEGCVVVAGGVEAVELLQGLPAGLEAGCASNSVRRRSRSASVRVSPLRSSANLALNTSGSKTGLTPGGCRRWTSRRSCVSPAENHLMTWKRSRTWRACPSRASMAAL